jgi:GNAT superfamily N-acetyltransferase
MPGGPIECELRLAKAEDRPFLIEMARAACTLEGRPLPPADDPSVAASLPNADGAAIVAAQSGGRLIGAAWWVIREPPLGRDGNGAPLPELVMGVVEEDRGKGVGTALIHALADNAAKHFSALTLNVHLLNPAIRLYIRTGFQVAGAGRGRFGVAMTRTLGRLSDS